MPIFLRSSCSGSEAQARKHVTSLAICDAVAGVPVHVGEHEWNKNRLIIVTIIIFNHVIVQDTSHGNGTTRHVWIVVKSITQIHASRRVMVPTPKQQ